MAKHEGQQIEIVCRDGGLIIGSWTIPGELVDNFDQQRALGWHIFAEFVNGAEEVVVRKKKFSPEEEI